MNRKLLLFAATILFAFNLFSQTEKGDIILSIDGNYSKSNTDYGVTKNQFATEGKHLDIGTSVGYFITSRLIAGIGLDYIWGKEDRANNLMIYDYYQLENTTVKSKAFLPNIYLGYYYPIINKF